VSAPVFSGLIGQTQAITALERALNTAQESNGQEMTHAWLFTGPPGSGRSNIAKAFTAALICKEGGCGACSDCVTTLAGTHPDVELVDVNGLSIKIDEIREIVTRSSWGASISKWRVVVIEDCDRMTEAAANALLKALEEPGASAIWLLCAPTLHDVLPTIRSRCRHVNLKTPTSSEIANYLVSDFGAKKEEAQLAAEISQGHIGKAKSLLKDEGAKSLRKKVFNLLLSVKSEADAIRAASELLNLAQERVERRFAGKIESESEELKTVMQSGTRGMINGGAKALKDLEKDQKARTNRAIKDEIDGFFLDYTTFFRDCLAKDSPLINSDLAIQISATSSSMSEGALNSLISSLNRVRELLTTNASQTLILESFFTQYTRHLRGN
jgi:DNA polymerase-3 subunit delta'